MKSERELESPKIGRQLHLEEARPDGMVRVWRHLYENEQELGPSIVADPEKVIGDWHHKRKGEAIREKDRRRQWQQQLKDWGFTRANKHKKIEELFEEAEQRLKDAGAWSLIENEHFTLEDRKRIHIILKSPPIRDPDSSEGITFYPNEDSMWADLHSGRDI